MSKIGKQIIDGMKQFIDAPPSEPAVCEACGKEIHEGDQCVTEPILTEMLGYSFCSVDCMEWWVESK